MWPLKKLTSGILLATLLSAEISYGETKQKVGIQAFQEIATDVGTSTFAFSNEIEKLINLNKDSVYEVKFPEAIKESIDKALKKIILAFQIAMEKASKINKEIASDDQIEQCSTALQAFNRDEFSLLKTEVEEYSKLSVTGKGKHEAMYILATDLSIRCGVTKAKLGGALQNCLVILDTQ